MTAKPYYHPEILVLYQFLFLPYRRRYDADQPVRPPPSERADDRGGERAHPRRGRVRCVASERGKEAGGAP